MSRLMADEDRGVHDEQDSVAVSAQKKPCGPGELAPESAAPPDGIDSTASYRPLPDIYALTIPALSFPTFIRLEGAGVPLYPHALDSLPHARRLAQSPRPL